MDILFIAPAFQPYCAVAATRPAAFARYLIAQGHSLRVLAAHNTRYPAITWPGIDQGLITYVPMWSAQDVVKKIRAPFKRKQAVSNSTQAAASLPTKTSPFKAQLYDTFDYLANYPDSYMGWIGNAKKAGEGLIKARRPELIFSTAPPHSANVVAAHLAQRFSVPWVAEYRDLWMDHPYHIPGKVRAFFENRLEARSMAPAKALVAVSEDARSRMAERFQKPAILSYNGYEPSWFDSESVEPPTDGRLTILYAGSVYVRTRTPDLLFQALQKLSLSPEDVVVRFYTSTPGPIQAMAERYGITDLVDICLPIPNEEVLKQQQSADVLLLMRWDDPREDGVIPGKVFEYIGAKRPILSVGSTRGEVADILSGRPDTVLSADPQTIVSAIQDWHERRKAGPLADVDWGQRERYERTAQFQKIEALLKDA
ncbi:MAG: glycosyltransferase [Sphingomonadales bacterium]